MQRSHVVWSGVECPSEIASHRRQVLHKQASVVLCDSESEKISVISLCSCVCVYVCVRVCACVCACACMCVLCSVFMLCIVHSSDCQRCSGAIPLLQLQWKQANSACKGLARLSPSSRFGVVCTRPTMRRQNRQNRQCGSRERTEYRQSRGLVLFAPGQQ